MSAARYAAIYGAFPQIFCGRPEEKFLSSDAEGATKFLVAEGSRSKQKIAFFCCFGWILMKVH